MTIHGIFYARFLPQEGEPTLHSWHYFCMPVIF